MYQLTIMNLDARTKPKKYSIHLILKNSTEVDMKLHSYVSSAPPLSKLPDILSRSNVDAPDNLEFDLSQDSEHGIWIRYRYTDDKARGFDIRIRIDLSKPQDIDISTDVYCIDGQEEKKTLSREAVYTMYDNGEATQYQVNDSTSDENVESENNLAASAHIQYDIVNADGWDLCAFIEIQLSMGTAL
jgi:hypothetical protein